MKKCKTNKFFRRYKPLFIILVIEVMVVLVFVQMWNKSKPLDEYSLKYMTICVDEIDDIHWTSGSRVYVFSDSVKYTFRNVGIRGGYSNSKLSQTIEVGDELHITYFIVDGIFGTANVVVDAYTENHVLRTIEGYVSDHKGVRVFETVIFFLMEILYFGFSVLYLWAHDLIKIKKTKKKKKRMTSIA